MRKEYEKTYHDVERDHWWFRARRKVLMDFIAKVPRDARVLDIGTSSGLMLQELRDAGFRPDNLFGVDISPQAIANCHQNGFTNTFVMDAHDITFEEASFDILIASDCLEHLERDEEALANWFKLLKPNGRLIVFVPAFKFLWSHHDDVNLHFRRYTNKELRTKLGRKSFTVQRSGYWNFLLFLPIAGVRLLTRSLAPNKSTPQGDLEMPGQAVNGVLETLVTTENRLMKVLRFPFGISTFCVATK